MQTWVFSPNKRTNALKKKKRQLLYPKPFLKILVQGQATPSLLQLLLQEQCKWKKKKVINHHSTRAKKNVGSLEASIQKIRTASVQSAPSFAFHFCHPLPSLTEEATGGRLRKKQMWQGQSLQHSKCHGASSTKVFCAYVCVCKYMCWFETCTPLKRYIAFLHNSAVPFGVVNEYWFKFFCFLPLPGCIFPELPSCLCSAWKMLSLFYVFIADLCK